jgi:hypothetical protein
MFVGIILGMVDGLVQGENTKEQRQEIRQILLSFQTASDTSLQELWPNLFIVKKIGAVSSGASS